MAWEGDMWELRGKEAIGKGWAECQICEGSEDTGDLDGM